MDEKLTVETLLKPFWTGDTVYQESLFFVKREAGALPESRLIFTPGKILSFKSADGTVSYIEGKDFTVDAVKKTLTLTKTSTIPYKTVEELYPKKDSPLETKISHKKGDPSTFLLFGEGFFFHKLQAEITYTHPAGEWKGYTPKYVGADLPNTMEKLKNKKPLKLCISGDSISAGHNASKLTGAAPFLPPYAELFALFLEKHFNTKIELKNFAVGGWNAIKGLADAKKAAAEKPDLTVIAYGMNDTTSKTPHEYGENVKGIMDAVKKENPKAEFILVASMLGNEEWLVIKENFFLFRDDLKKLCGKGVVLADLTEMWDSLLSAKSFHDLTGNGVNHPNDFGHRIYAQVLLSLLNE